MASRLSEIMKKQEWDDLRRGELAALQAQVGVLERVEDLIKKGLRKAQDARLLEETPRPGRRPFRLLAGKQGLRTMLGWPDFVRMWDVVVPFEYLDENAVHCVCGSVTTLQMYAVTKCSGCCGRSFLTLESEVRVHRFVEQAELP